MAKKSRENLGAFPHNILRQWVLAGILWLSFGNIASAQNERPNWHEHTVDRDTLLSLDGILVPNTLNFSPTLAKSKYEVRNGQLHIRINEDDPKIRVQWRTFEHVFDRDSVTWTSHLSLPDFSDLPSRTSQDKAFKIADSEGLSYQGSFGRGVQVGSNQSLLLQSNFNLQMSGSLGDDIEVLGAISDNHLAIQPEGDTRQLEEFDKVFVQVRRKEHQLTAGDYQILSPKGYFMRYNSKLSGLQYQYHDSISQHWDLKSEVGYAASRGKFARNTLTPMEGNQGPYPLSGNAGERFLVILAGTERVFWDGELLIRGADQDYTMDYNQGQLTFSYKRLVNENVRIIVEFEYIERQYGRSNTTANAVFSGENALFYINAYQHLDSRTPSGNFTLDSTGLRQLSLIGDHLEDASIDGGYLISPEEALDRVTYSQKDTAVRVNGQNRSYQIYSYQPRPIEGNVYQVQFTHVGHNQGHYRLTQSSANGRVYQWVAPDSTHGQLLGDYEARQPLKAPEAHQIMTLGGIIHPLSNLSVQTEALITNKDKNRLSSLDDDDNTGWGLLTQIHHTLPLPNDLQIKSGYRTELISKEKEILSPFRNAEFNRDWGLDTVNRTDEWLQTFSMGLFHKDRDFVEYKTDLYKRGASRPGQRHHLLTSYNLEGWLWSTHSTLTKTEWNHQKTLFVRPKIGLSKTFSKWHNLRFNSDWMQEKKTDEVQGFLSPSSFYFDQWKVDVSLPMDLWGDWSVGYRHRRDFLADSATFRAKSQATDLFLLTKWHSGPRFHLNLDVRWRAYRPSTSTENQPPRNTLLIRADNASRLFNEAITIQTVYELSSGQEPLLEYVFEERRPGEGQFIYEDLNMDGIAQINEYIAAPFADTARYVRIQLVNNEFIQTQNLSFSQNLRILPSKFWREKAPFWTEKLLWTTLIKTDNKSTVRRAVNPYAHVTDNTGLLIFQSTVQHQLHINQGSPNFDLILGHHGFRQHCNQTSGIEGGSNVLYFLRGRYNLWKTSELITRLEWQREKGASQFFSERRFDLAKKGGSLKWNSVFQKRLRLTLDYDLSQSKNDPAYGIEKATIQGLGAELSLRKASTLSILAGFKYQNVQFHDGGNISLNYHILGGLRAGQNFEWRLQTEHLIFSNIQLSLGYLGRKNGSGKIIHSGTANFKALF